MDLLKFNPCNLDHLTETYNIGFYLEYFSKWPQLCKVIEGMNGEIEAYSKPLIEMRQPSDRKQTNKLRSPRQSRVLPLPSARRALRPRPNNLPQKVAQLPALACTHNLPDGRTGGTASGPRDAPERGARGSRRERAGVVRGPVRAGGERGGDQAVQEDGLLGVSPYCGLLQ